MLKWVSFLFILSGRSVGATFPGCWRKEWSIARYFWKTGFTWIVVGVSGSISTNIEWALTIYSKTFITIQTWYCIKNIFLVLDGFFRSGKQPSKKTAGWKNWICKHWVVLCSFKGPCLTVKNLYDGKYRLCYRSNVCKLLLKNLKKEWMLLQMMWQKNKKNWKNLEERLQRLVMMMMMHR